MVLTRTKGAGLTLTMVLSVSGVLFEAQTKPADGLPDVFPLGETLVYEVHWSPPAWMFFLPTISAGEMTLKVQDLVTHKGKPAYKITADAVSSGFLPRVTGIAIKDYFESVVDAREFCSFKMTKKTREGKRQRDVFLSFDEENGKGRFVAYDVSKSPPVELKNEEVKNLPSCVQDFLSAVYHTRLRELRVGATYPLTVSDNGMVRQIEISVIGREVLATALGAVPSLKLETVSLFGGLFKDGGKFLVWLADDQSKVPLRFEAKVKLGKVFGSVKKIERTTPAVSRL